MEQEELKINEENQKYIDGAEDEKDREVRREVIQRALELNGAVEAAQPGMAVSYINREHYVRLVSIEGFPETARNTLEQALNWEALGRGKGGLAGAAARFKLRNLFSNKRECVIVDAFDKKWAALMKEYVEYAANNKFFFATWFANAWNIVGLATSSFIRECHHWNAQNTRPIKALCGSLNMDQELQENEYRKAFYLAIHPLPLIYLTAAYAKSRDPSDLDISETVRQRLNVPPAGYADFCACGVAAQSFLTEKYAGHAALIGDIKYVLRKTNELRKAPLGYNPFAAQLGVAKKEFSKARYTEAMIVLAAYAKSQIGGTLAKSPALSKFIEAHQRKVNKFIDAFEYYSQKKSDDLFSMITGKSTSSLEDLPDKLKPLLKVQAQVAEIGVKEVTGVVTQLVTQKVDELLRETRDYEAKPLDPEDEAAYDDELDIENDVLAAYLGLHGKSKSKVEPVKGKTPEVDVEKPV